MSDNNEDWKPNSRDHVALVCMWALMTLLAISVHSCYVRMHP